jgi:hypothetical protein
MASPGPRLHDHAGSDSGDLSDPVEFPIIQQGGRRRPRPQTQPPLFDSDDEGPSQPPAVQHSEEEAEAPIRQRRRAAALPSGSTDANGYAWFTEEDLSPPFSSADCRYFFGQREQDGSFKCRLCPYAFRSHLPL